MKVCWVSVSQLLRDVDVLRAGDDVTHERGSVAQAEDVSAGESQEG